VQIRQSFRTLALGCFFPALALALAARALAVVLARFSPVRAAIYSTSLCTRRFLTTRKRLFLHFAIIHQQQQSQQVAKRKDTNRKLCFVLHPIYEDVLVSTSLHVNL
jgi:hypothetical protein